MKVIYDPALFDAIPGLCVGILAIRAADNHEVNLEAEAFRRRCCTETNLLLKMNPAMADAEIKQYKDALALLGIEGRPALEVLFENYKKELGIEEKKEAEAEAEENLEILSLPKAANLDELAGSDVLPRINPLMDIIRAGMLKFHVDIHGYDMNDRTAPLHIHQKDGGWTVSLGNDTATCGWYCKDGTAAAVTENSEDPLILITGFAQNRKKVAAARNELARRMKSAFDRSVEVGWIEGKDHEFISAL